MQADRRSFLIAGSSALFTANSTAFAQDAISAARTEIAASIRISQELRQRAISVARQLDLSATLNILAADPVIGQTEIAVRQRLFASLQAVPPQSQRQLVLPAFQIYAARTSDYGGLLGIQEPIRPLNPAPYQRGSLEPSTMLASTIAQVLPVRRFARVVDLIASLLDISEVSRELVQFFRNHPALAPIVERIEGAIGQRSFDELLRHVEDLLTQLFTIALGEFLELLRRTSGQRLIPIVMARLAIRFLGFVGIAIIIIEIAILLRRDAPDIFIS